ncbi:MAG: hypothetical protein AB3N16_13560 [Flavobacteriaceae bacterium]
MLQKLRFPLLAGLILISSCSISKGVRDQRNLLSGTWSLNDVSYGNAEGTFSSVLFNDADAKCFQGSERFLRDNNSTGLDTLETSAQCNGGDRIIRWSVVEHGESYTNQLQFKMIDEKLKDISGLGYRLNITTLTATDMVLTSNSKVGDDSVTVIYSFTKK